MRSCYICSQCVLRSKLVIKRVRNASWGVLRASWEIWRASRRVSRGGLEGYLGIWRPIQGNLRGDGEIEKCRNVEQLLKRYVASSYHWPLKFGRMGRFSVQIRTSEHPSIHPSVCPYVPHLRAQEPVRKALDPDSQATEPGRQASEPARQASEAARQASEPARQASEPLQDFVPYQGCCPVTAQL